jgi:rRNA biogenesis protein RRP5
VQFQLILKSYSHLRWVIEPQVLGRSSICPGSQIAEVSNVTSVLPGILGQALITAVSPSGLNLQLLGFFDATADEFHVPANPAKAFKTGQKVKARILYEIPGHSPPRFSVSLLDHVLSLEEKHATHGISDRAAVPSAYPTGTILDGVKVKRIEPERGLVVEVQSHLDGFIHVNFALINCSRLT